MSVSFNKYQLCVEQLSRGRWYLYRPILREWADTALKKMAVALEENAPIFASCESVLSGLGRYFDSSRERELYACKDKKAWNQGFLLLEDDRKGDTLEICTLVTNPINVRDPCNEDEPNRVQGAGTSMMVQTMERAKELGRKFIGLNATESSENFYRSFGFSDDQDTVYDWTVRTEALGAVLG